MFNLCKKIFFRIKIRQLYFFTFLISLLFSSVCFAQEESKPCEKVEKILYLIKKVHYQSPEFDKTFASKVIDSYLFDVDGQCSSLYDKDILYLKDIQNQETSPTRIFCRSFDFLLSIYENRLKESDSLTNSCINKKYVWHNNDSLVFYNSFKNNYPKNITQKINKIDNWVRLYTLGQLELASRLNKDFEFEKNNDLKIKAINKLRKNFRKKINNPIGIESYLEESLLQAIISTCDPHSNYFTASANKEFRESLSTTVEIYGFSFNENKNEHIEITAIAPGSPAWKSNSLNVGDRVTKIKFNNKPQIDVSDYDIYEFNDLFSKAPEKEIDITVLKKNGAVVETHLAKEILKSEDNNINSYILSQKQEIGYISLPSFYTDFSKNTPFGCANDVAKEIIKLKEDNIKGLILDLRNNGGGSIEEATNLAGIFIDAAPLFIEKIQSQKPRVIKDLNRGAIYSGPLVIIINNGSASASELLAQILKTQHRAIIVGSNSYGKATGQIVVPLDTSYNMFAGPKIYNETNGYLKITIEKLYDLSGATYQKIGVMPNIPIPDLWSSFSVGENEYSNALLNDVIVKKIKVDALPDEKINICADLSATRIKTDNQFKRLATLADTLKILSENNTILLYPLAYNKALKTTNAIDSIIDKTFSNNYNLFTVKPNKNNSEVMKMDEFLQNLINAKMEDLKKDIILQESYNILTDYNSN